MESRKNQLKKQIVEALKSNDRELYSLLKSQWAHRFGVESLEELNHLDSIKENLNLDEVVDQKIDQVKNNFVGNDLGVSFKENDIPINREELLEKNDTFLNENKAREVVDPINYEANEKINNKVTIKETVNLVSETKGVPQVQVLIPIPPKPKYSYLKRWLINKI